MKMENIQRNVYDGDKKKESISLCEQQLHYIHHITSRSNTNKQQQQQQQHEKKNHIHILLF